MGGVRRRYGARDGIAVNFNFTSHSVFISPALFAQNITHDIVITFLGLYTSEHSFLHYCRLVYTRLI